MPLEAELRAKEAFEEWYNSLKVYKASRGPARGTLGTALVILERLKNNYDLNIDNHTARGGTQIRGATAGNMNKILADLGETRPFLKEAGRTNRGAKSENQQLLVGLESANLDELPGDMRLEILTSLQRLLVTHIRNYHEQERITFEYDPSGTTWDSIRGLLETANARGKEGQVAQHLVGAKLQLRYPEIPIQNEPVSAADEQTGRPGDFLLNDTVLHVTVAPAQALFDKCKHNLSQSYRVYVLVSERTLEAARQLAALTNPGQIFCQSIESFVSQNLDELSEFSKQVLPTELKALLETYNKRVDSAELDKSLLIDIPSNL